MSNIAVAGRVAGAGALAGLVFLLITHLCGENDRVLVRILPTWKILLEKQYADRACQTIGKVERRSIDTTPAEARDHTKSCSAAERRTAWRGHVYGDMQGYILLLDGAEAAGS